MDSSSSNVDARGCNFSVVGRDQINIHQINIHQTYDTYISVNSFSLFGPRQIAHHIPSILRDNLPRPISSANTLAQRHILTYRAPDTATMVDITTDLIDQITAFLLDRNHSLNNLRDVALELESLHQTLTLIKLTIQKYNKTPLGQSLTDFIAPEINRCFAALQGLLGSTDDVRLRLSSTSIGHLWRLVWRAMLRDEFASVRKKLSISRQSFQALLFTLHSVALAELGTELRAGLSTLRRFHTFNNHILPSLYHIKLNTVDVLSHLGEIIPVPTIFCSTWKDFHYVVRTHCRNRVGIDFIERGDYEVVRANDSQIIQPSDLGSAVESGIKLEMSILLRPEASFRDSKEKCPRCHHINLNATVDLGWIHCRKCFGLFQIADANQHQTRLAGRGDKARNGLTDEERREGDAQSGNEELASPASRTNRNDASESYTITNQQERNGDGTQFFRRIRVICMDDGISLPRSKVLGQNQIGINDVLGHLLYGTQHVADADEQLEAALKSFKMIENWYEARSATVNAAVAVAMTGARTMSRDYVEAVESSVKVAGHGVAFAADVVVLCEHLNQGRDSGIHSFIDDMRLIARLAQSETKTTHGRFGAIRLKLYQLTMEIPAQQQDFKGGQDNCQHHTQRDLICALELLRKAFDDIGQLVDGVAKFAHWWSEAESVISTLEKQMFVDGRRISLLQLDKAQKGWEAVRDRYEVYSRVIDTLTDYYSIDNMCTFTSILDKFKALFMRRRTG